MRLLEGEAGGPTADRRRPVTAGAGRRAELAAGPSRRRWKARHRHAMLGAAGGRGALGVRWTAMLRCCQTGRLPDCKTARLQDGLGPRARATHGPRQCARWAGRGMQRGCGCGCGRGVVVERLRCSWCCWCWCWCWCSCSRSLTRTLTLTDNQGEGTVLHSQESRPRGSRNRPGEGKALEKSNGSSGQSPTKHNALLAPGTASALSNDALPVLTAADWALAGHV